MDYFNIVKQYWQIFFHMYVLDKISFNQFFMQIYYWNVQSFLQFWQTHGNMRPKVDNFYIEIYAKWGGRGSSPHIYLIWHDKSWLLIDWKKSEKRDLVKVIHFMETSPV